MFKLLKTLGQKIFNQNDNKYGNTPLHVAAKLGDFNKVESLLKNGAIPEARNYYNETPMDIIKKYEVLSDKTISWNHVLAADILSNYIVNTANIIDLPDYTYENMQQLFRTHLIGITHYDNEGVPHTDF